MFRRRLALFLVVLLMLASAPSYAQMSLSGVQLQDSDQKQKNNESVPGTNEKEITSEEQTSSAPQTARTLDPHAEEIRRKVQQMGISSPITVVMKNKEDFYGHITRIKSDLFEINEVDQKQLVSIDYKDVKKVREGYGTTRNIRGNRIHPHTKLIVLTAFVGALILIVALAARGD